MRKKCARPSVGAVPATGSHPSSGKALPAYSDTGESYGETKVGATMVATAAPKGKGSVRRDSKSVPFRTQEQVGATAVASVAPKGKADVRRSSKYVPDSTQEVGAAAIASVAPKGKAEVRGKSRFLGTAGEEVGAAVIAYAAPKSKAEVRGRSTRGIGPRTSNYEELSGPGLEQEDRDSALPLAQFPGAESYNHPPNSITGRRIAGKNRLSHSTSSETYEQDLMSVRSDGERRSLTGERRSEKSSIDGAAYSSIGEEYEGIDVRSKTEDSLAQPSLSPEQFPPDSEVPVLDAPVVFAMEAVDEDSKHPERLYRKRWVKIVAVLALVGIVIAVVLPVVVVSGDDGPSGTPAPTPPSDASLARQADVRAILVDVTDPVTLEGDTPQRAAFDWIVYEDLLSPISNEGMTEEERSTLIQRYVLAVLYYATNGEGWFSNGDWLEGDIPECSWAIVTCVQEAVVALNSGDRNNMVGSIPSELRELASLRTIKFSNNKINSVHGDIGQLPKLGK
jgi:hypothetical protein